MSVTGMLYSKRKIPDNSVPHLSPQSVKNLARNITSDLNNLISHQSRILALQYV